MGFWIAITLTLLAVTAALALGARRIHGKSVGEADLALYRDQLREVERDLARGTLTPEEAGRIRLEVSRRLLAADRAAQAAAVAGRGPLLPALALAGLALAGSVLLYGWLGAPGYGDQPRAGRIARAEQAHAARPSQAQMEAALPAWSAPAGTDPAWLDLVARLRSALQEHPDDARGLALLASNEAQLGNFAGAWRAQERLNALGPARTADLLAQVALMLQAAAGQVSPEAEAVLARILQRDPQDGGARYFMGLLQAQIGRPDRTFELWAPLLAGSKSGDWWVAPLRADLPTVAALAGQNRYELPPPPPTAPPPAGAPPADLPGLPPSHPSLAAPAAPPGPSAADMDAAAALSAEERGEMIRSMVEGLSDRLATRGGPAEDWARLIQALGVLGERERAAAIAEEARQVFAADAGALARIEAAARAAGLGG